MDLFDWDQFNASDNVDMCEMLASIPPFDAPIEPLHPQPVDSSDAGVPRQADCGGSQSYGNMGPHNVLGSGSDGPPYPQVRPHPGFLKLTYWMSSASRSLGTYGT